MVLKPLQDLIVIALVVLTFMGTGWLVIWFAIKDHMSRFDQVEIITSITSFIPDYAWYAGQLLVKYLRLVSLAIVAIADAALAGIAAQRVNDGTWSFGWTVAGFITLIVLEGIATILFCINEDGKEQGWRRC